MDPKALGQFLMQPSTADVLNTPVRRGGILPVTEYPNRTEFDLSSGLTGALMDAFTAPARAARGEISEDQQIPEAFNFAGSLTLGSLLAPRPTGSVGMGGRGAKGALDMSEAARMARAKEMGFDTDQTWYHGTYRDFDKFDPNIRLPVKDVLTGNEIDNPFEPMGAVFFSDNPSIASNQRYTGFPSDPGRVIPAHIRAKNVKTVDMNGGAGGEDVFIKQAKNEGYDAIKFINMEDVGSGGLQNQLAVFDPSNIRSVNAAFDPAKSSSANMLAANAKTGAAVPLATKALEAQQPQGIRAFHGSPHDFDRFSMDAIGTGEGAQAYGHGLYFAEAEDVARSYRENLTRGVRTGSGPGRIDVFTVDGAEVPASQKSVADIAHTMREYSIDPNTADGLDWLQREVGARGLPFETIEQAANLYKRDITRNTVDGRMYEVNIKADPNDFLDWDKPLSQQSEKVKDAVHSALMAKGIGRTLADYIVNSDKPARDAITTIARGAYDTRLNMPDGPMAAQASQALREVGIPGVRYLDQMSRGEGKGSSNYVVFDDNLIEILRKYGLLGPVAGGGTLAGMLMGGQEGETY